jgi:hypothetical protein
MLWFLHTSYILLLGGLLGYELPGSESCRVIRRRVESVFGRTSHC